MTATFTAVALALSATVACGGAEAPAPQPDVAPTRARTDASSAAAPSPQSAAPSVATVPTAPQPPADTRPAEPEPAGAEPPQSAADEAPPGLPGGRAEAGDKTPIDDLLVHLDHYVSPPMKKVMKTKWGIFDRLPFRITVRFCVAEDGRTRDVTWAWARDDVLAVRSLLVAAVKQWRFDPVAAGHCSEVLFRGGEHKWLWIRGPGNRVSRIRPDVVLLDHGQHMEIRDDFFHSEV